MGILILPLALGIGLVIYFVAGVSLRLSVSITFLWGLICAILVIGRLPQEYRRKVAWRAWIGACAGLLGTSAYDVMRYIVVKGFHYQFWPFDIFMIFGQLLAGYRLDKRFTEAVGVMFHVACGMGFGIAYTLTLRRPSVLSGLLWAGVLELFMISLYPGWLRLKALNELLSVSVAGHAAYGAVLGSVSRHFICDAEWGLL